MMARTFLLAGAAALILGAMAVANYHSGRRDASDGREVATAGKVSFALEVTERGLVQPAKVEPIKSQISSNQARVVWLYPEGRPVDKGLIVARFDTKPFLDRLLKARQEVADAEASHVAAKKVLEIQREEESGKLEAARRKLEIATIKAEDLRQGSGRLSREKLVKAVNKAERSHAVARGELTDFELLLEKGYVSQREYDKVANQLRAAEETLELVTAELANFDKFEWPRLLREAKLLVEAEQTNLERVRRTSTLEIQRREGEVEKYRRLRASAGDSLDQARRDVENCDVRAPIDGILLYVELSKAEGRRKTQIGDAIWFGQTFMEIPDTRDMVVELAVREVDVAKLKPGMAAGIELDAFRGRSFAGRLLAIDSLAQEGENGHLREFRAKVRFTEPAADVHVGMSATVKIPYRRLEQVVAVPVSAVTYAGGDPRVWRVPEQGPPHPRSISLGVVGVQWAEVRAGLKAGERVILEAP